MKGDKTQYKLALGDVGEEEEEGGGGLYKLIRVLAADISSHKGEGGGGRGRMITMKREGEERRTTG